MEKVKVRRILKPGRKKRVPNIDLTYEVDPFDRELLAHLLEHELEDSLDELERTLKKRAEFMEA